MRGVIYGRSLETAQAKLQEIINNYIYYDIATTITHKYSKWHGDIVEFSNGDIWEACVPNKNTLRGKKYNVAYIDHMINIDLLEEIMATITAQPFQAWHRF